jgi:hypothetical protein
MSAPPLVRKANNTVEPYAAPINGFWIVRQTASKLPLNLMPRRFNNPHNERRAKRMLSCFPRKKSLVAVACALALTGFLQFDELEITGKREALPHSWGDRTIVDSRFDTRGPPLCASVFGAIGVAAQDESSSSDFRKNAVGEVCRCHDTWVRGDGLHPAWTSQDRWD